MHVLEQGPKSYANLSVSSFQSQARLEPSLSRKFAIDLCPRLIWSSGSFVEMLLKSSVSRYLEFKCLHSCAMHIDQHFEEVCVEQSI
jgi:RAB protein geranylgeranyltransferase component A